MIDSNALRKKVLDLAIRGKLVPQNPEDEPASVLLERIREEKQRLIREGKIKKDKVDSIIFRGDDNCHYEKIGDSDPVLLEDVPFDIPNGWAWARLLSIADISAGGTPNRGVKKYWENGTIPWLKISDITSADKYVNNAEEYITEEGLKNSSAQYYEKGTILYTIFATVGEVGILDFKATCNQAIAGIKCFDNDFLDYLYYYLKNLKDFMLSQSKGNAQVNINQSKLKAALISIPPLAEQKRIVKFINVIFDIINQLENSQDDYANLVEALKKAILQSAIQGTLVEQCADDEPASILLEKIRTEKKAQLGKKYVESYIYKGSDNRYYEKNASGTQDITDEIPFDIPHSWEWARLDSLALYRKGPFGSSLTKSMFVPFSKNSIKVYEQKNAIEKDFYLGHYYISLEKFEQMRSFEVFPNDIIVSCAGTIGEAYVIPADAPKGIINQALMRIKLYDYAITDFYLLYFDYVLKREANDKGKGSAIKNIPPFDVLKKMLMPIPPLEEQKRVIEQVNSIFLLLKDEV